ncbi:Mg/Co/Ni transporter MgtE [Halorubrum trapanicum]|uniref:Mg/Co/Ni transporter MgtE n=1 Tax=Halorubrum trapanicum TaxID=29284 RepID=A0A8J7R7U6_9EURY|nr:hypothetical protein [Halorubrum trapanicum]MBP1901233.1 Mg/Co/Ni transporter MgtE [Halorubrum trapanicum]
MDSQSEDVRETIAMSPDPSEPFAALPEQEWRDVFLTLAEDVRAAVAADMSRSRLEAFVDRLDPDEITDVLGFFVFLGLAGAVLL